MRCVDDGVDTLGLEIRCKALSAAEAADPLWDRRGRRLSSRAGERDERRDAGLIRQAACERAGFRRSAENEEAKALQGAAP
jgi:hypothetical protein